MTTLPPWRTGESAVEAKPPSGTRAREPPWLLLDIDVDAKAKGLKRKASEAGVPDIMSEVSADNEGDDAEKEKKESRKSQGKWKKECLRLAELVLKDDWDGAEVKANALYMWPNSNH